MFFDFSGFSPGLPCEPVPPLRRARSFSVCPPWIASQPGRPIVVP